MVEDPKKDAKIGTWKGSIGYYSLWPDKSLDIWHICDDESAVYLRWKNNRIEDYVDLADAYFESAVIIANEIMQAGHDNVKDDTWFLTDLFLFRQAIELVLKAVVYRTIPKLTQVQKIFEHSEHNVTMLFESIQDYTALKLTLPQKRWLECYLEDLEYWDSQSSLFRFPFKVTFFDKRPPSFVNIFETVTNLGIAFSLIHRSFDDCFTDAEKYEIDIPEQLPSEKLFSVAKDGIGNCYLTGYGRSETYFAVISGYESASEYLLTGHMKKNSPLYWVPAVFLLRHLLELELKQLASSDFSKMKRLKINRGTHLIYKKLWKKIFPVIAAVNGENSDDTIGMHVDTFIKQFERMDPQGDFFRYPTEFNHQYHIMKRKIDPINVLKCVRAVTNLLEGSDAMLENYAEIEAEMYQNYLDELGDEMFH